MFDWLANGRKPPSHAEFERYAAMEILRDLQERQKKIWDTVNAIREHQITRDGRH